MKYLVSCSVSPAYFQNEFFVSLDNCSVVVDRAYVSFSTEPSRDKAVTGSVVVYALSNADDQTLIELPGQPVFGSLRTWISNSQLQKIA